MPTRIPNQADPLFVSYCTPRAAATAAKRWHYSKTIPVGRQIKYGVWESGKFIGAVCFGMGAAPALHRRFGVGAREVAELTRVALDRHASPVTRIVRVAINLLRADNPGLRVLVSFADPAQGHIGGIYQAGGWMYLGRTAPTISYQLGGKLYHNRSLSGSNFGGARPPKANMDRAVKITNEPKYRYALALNKSDRKRLEHMREPYPKRAKPSSEAACVQQEEGGAIPTRALQDANR